MFIVNISDVTVNGYESDVLSQKTQVAHVSAADEMVTVNNVSDINTDVSQYSDTVLKRNSNMAERADDSTIIVHAKADGTTTQRGKISPRNLTAAADIGNI